ncbi:hypothetical protein LZK73_18640 [Neorhizobium galegae]|nr:hypothetical protein LZK73_18640 [Neorhizobium galegae]
MSEVLDHLIKKGSYFYRPNKAGYTSFKFDAGRYTKADAEAEASVEPWHMKALHQDSVPDDTAPDRHVSELKAEIAELRAKLFPYADATEIGGISWDGKYLIGDKASIRFFHEMKNRGEQIDVYKRAYDQNLAAKDAEIERLKRVVRASKPYVDRGVSDAQKRGAVTMADILVPELIDAALSKQESTNA